MSSWNHRVVRKTDGDFTYLGIHEVYYDDDGKIWGITEDPAQLFCEEDEGVEALQTTLRWMIEATKVPVVDYDSIPEEGSEPPGFDVVSEEDLISLDELKEGIDKDGIDEDVEYVRNKTFGALQVPEDLLEKGDSPPQAPGQ